MRGLVAILTSALLCLMNGASAFMQSNSFSIAALEVSPNGETIAVLSTIGRLHLFDVETLAELQDIPADQDSISNIEWSPDGGKIAVAGFGGLVAVYDAHSGNQIVSANVTSSNGTGHTIDEIIAISWSPDSSTLAVSGQEGGTIILNALTGIPLAYAMSGETYDSTWSPSANLATSGLTGLKIWNSGQVVMEIPGLSLTQAPGIIPDEIAYNSSAELLAAIISTYAIENDTVQQGTELRIYEWRNEIASP